MESSSRSSDRVNVGGVVSETFSIYRANVGVLLGVSVLIFVVVGLIAGILSNNGVILALVAAIIQLAAYALYAGFVVRLVQDVRDGRRDQTVGDLISSATPSIVPLILFGILFGIGVTIGFILLIVPGLILITIWCVGAPAIVVENEGVIGAFGRSRNLVRGEGWSVFAALLVILLIVIAIGIVLSAIATPISDGAIIVANIISNIITAPIFALAVSTMFFDLGGGAGASTTGATAAPEVPGSTE